MFINCCLLWLQFHTYYTSFKVVLHYIPMINNNYVVYLIIKGIHPTRVLNVKIILKYVASHEIYKSTHYLPLGQVPLLSVPSVYVTPNDFPTDLKDKEIPKSVTQSATKSVTKSATVISVIGQKCTI